MPYGIEVGLFKIVAYSKPTDDPDYIKLKELLSNTVVDIGAAKLESEKQAIMQDIKARGVIVDSEAQAKKRQIENYTYQEEKSLSSDPTADFRRRVEKLKILYENSMITEQEYEERKRKLLDEA